MEDLKSLEMIIMELVVGGGDARSSLLEAIRLARQGNFTEADEKLKDANKALDHAHEIQIELIQKEAAGEHMQVPLLMVHAQDHLMNAMTVRDLAEEIIAILREREETK